MRLSDLKPGPNRTGDGGGDDDSSGSSNSNSNSNDVRPATVSRARRTRTSPDDLPSYVSPAETRKVQVKAAVFPTEKPIFETLAARRNVTLSDLIRDFLIGEARKDGLI